MKRGIDVGACVPLDQLKSTSLGPIIEQNFTLVANQFDSMEWRHVRGYNGAPPSLGAFQAYIDAVKQTNLKLRARQVYSHENLPPNAHLRTDGTPKNKSELEKTLIERAHQVCAPLKGMNATIQVIDEILADHEGGLRKDPFSEVLGEEMVDILFHASREAAPDALLTYQEFGPEVDSKYFFKKKTKDYLSLLERLRKRNVPVTGAALGGWVHPWSFNGRGWSLDRSIFKKIESLDYDIHVNEITVVYEEYGAPKSWHPRDQKSNDETVDRLYKEAFAFFCEFKRLREIDFWAPFDNANTLTTGTLGLKPYSKARPGIFDTELKPKPVYWHVAELIEKSRARF